MPYLTKLSAIILLTSFPTWLWSNTDTTPIEKLIASGELKVEITAKGGHRGECIRLIASNTGSKFFITRIEPGRILTSSNASHQDILVTQEVLLALSPEQRIERAVYGFCCQSQNSSPTEEAEYTIGNKADPYTQRLAQFLNKHRDIDPGTQQSAVWVLSDCHPPSSISSYNDESDALLAFTSDLLGIPKPWYATAHMRTVDELFNRQVERLYGEMPFQIQHYQKVSVIIYNSQNRIVKKLLQGSSYGPGSYTYPLDIHVKSWPKDIYKVAFEDEQKEEFKSFEFEL